MYISTGRLGKDKVLLFFYLFIFFFQQGEGAEHGCGPELHSDIIQKLTKEVSTMYVCVLVCCGLNVGKY